MVIDGDEDDECCEEVFDLHYTRLVHLQKQNV